MSDAATQEAVNIYNDAMDLLGQKRIDAFDDTSPTSSQASGRFQRIARFCLGLYPWSWQIQRLPLSRQAAASATSYAYGYAITGGGKILAVYDDADSERPFQPYRLIGSIVHADCEAVWADVQSPDVYLGVQQWSPSFRMAVINSLAADACMKNGGTRTEKADLIASAHGPLGSSEYPRGGLIAAAAGEDGQQDGGGVMQLANGRLVDARRS